VGPAYIMHAGPALDSVRRHLNLKYNAEYRAQQQWWASEPAHTRDLLIPLTHTEMLWLSVWRRALD